MNIRGRYINFTSLIFLLLVLILFPRFIKTNYHMFMVNLSIIYSVLALGLNFPLGITGQASLGHAAFWGIGSYATAITATRLGWPFYLSMPAACICGIISGFLLGLPTTRLRGRYLALATMGFGQVSFIVMLNWHSLTGGPNGIANIPRPIILGYQLTGFFDMYYFCLFFLFICLIISTFFLKSRFGRAMKGVRENEMAAEVLGVPTHQIKILAFTMSSLIAAIGGSLYVYNQAYVEPVTFTMFESLRILTMVFIGGAGTFFGPVLGAVILTLLPELVRGLQDYYMMFYGGGVVLLMIFLPSGVIGIGQSILTKLKIIKA